METQTEIKQFSFRNWNDCKMDGQPELGGEYNVVWVLDDNEYPVAASMDYDSKTKRWTDPRADGKDVTDSVIYWQELPEPPVGIPAKVWKKTRRC